MSTLKLSWGTRIALLYGSFVVLIVILVAGSMRQSFDLVTPDYYSQEIKYQQVIDADKNLSQLSSKAKMDVTANDVVISFPAEFGGKTLNGTVQFYSPIKTAWDKKMNLAVTNNTMTVPRQQLQPTTYTVKLSWVADGKNYYQETDINLH
ncbi:MAG: FixH family protein [Bacteroidetes bacterium]|nr:FixH family protein [Bacteroidota bacterium]